MQGATNGVVTLKNFVLAVWQYDPQKDPLFKPAVDALEKKKADLDPFRKAIYSCTDERISYVPIANMLRKAWEIMYENSTPPRPNDYYLNLAAVGSKKMGKEVDRVGRTLMSPDMALVVTDVRRDLMDLEDLGEARTGWCFVAVPFEVKAAPKTADGKMRETRGRMQAPKG